MQPDFPFLPPRAPLRLWEPDVFWERSRLSSRAACELEPPFQKSSVHWKDADSYARFYADREILRELFKQDRLWDSFVSGLSGPDAFKTWKEEHPVWNQVDKYRGIMAASLGFAFRKDDTVLLEGLDHLKRRAGNSLYPNEYDAAVAIGEFAVSLTRAEVLGEMRVSEIGGMATKFLLTPLGAQVDCVDAGREISSDAESSDNDIDWQYDARQVVSMKNWNRWFEASAYDLVFTNDIFGPGPSGIERIANESGGIHLHEALALEYLLAKESALAGNFIWGDAIRRGKDTKPWKDARAVLKSQAKGIPPKEIMWVSDQRLDRITIGADLDNQRHVLPDMF